MIPQTKLDLIFNSLLIGMALPDAYIYAGLSEKEIVEANEDNELQRKWQSLSKGFEYGLLQKLNAIADKQMHMGREQAVVWLLEHTNPRYSGKPQNEMPELHLHLESTDPKDVDTVEIHRGEVK